VILKTSDDGEQASFNAPEPTENNQEPDKQQPGFIPSMFQKLTTTITQPKPANEGHHSSDEFEQLAESRDLIEDRLFRIKMHIVNFTIQQSSL